MFQVRFYHAFPTLGAFFIVLSLALAACAPLQAPAAVVPSPASTGNPIPITGGGTTSTPTLAPTFTPTVAAASPTPTLAAPTATVAAPAAPAPVKMLALKTAKNKKLGTILVDSNGMTLYIDKDDPGNASTCAATWPPALVQGSSPTAGKGVNASLLGMFTRPEGTQQATYKGHPLYYFSGDLQPGDVKGQGIGKQWSVVVLAKPVVHKAAHPSSDNSNSSSSSNSAGNHTNNGGGSNGGSGGMGGGMGGNRMP